MSTRRAAVTTAATTRAGGDASDGFATLRAMPVDLTDPELREELAKASYYRERYNDMVADQEHELDPDAQYFCLEWESLSTGVQRPYRVAVGVTLDHVGELAGARG